VLKDNSTTDQTGLLQNAFNNNNTVVISTNTIINGTVSIPEGKILKFDGEG
jgi:hypothetical protein